MYKSNKSLNWQTIEAQKKLYLLEKEEKDENHRKQIKEKSKSKEFFKRKKDEGSSGTFKNKCTRCKNNIQELFDCPTYNNNSKFYNAREAVEQIHENHVLDRNIDREVYNRFESNSD